MMAISHPVDPIGSDAKDEPLIKVDRVSKKYARNLQRSMHYGVLEMLGEFSPRRVFRRSGRNDDAAGEARLRESEFYANLNISFEVRRGECWGLIGHNGAGKTTLLKMLNGLIKPDSGRIELRGRIGALIALGAGFNPVLTGRENVYINGAILGISPRDMKRKIESIIDYAEVEDAIDSPVRTYSSGMQARLGFSIAINLEPDVLLIDEVLAVGDQGFRNKCMNSIRDILPRTAVIFVSHSMSAVTSLCTHAVLMKDGRIEKAGADLQSIVASYLLGFEEESVHSAEPGGVVVNEPGSAFLREISINGKTVPDGKQGLARWSEAFKMEFLVEGGPGIGQAMVNVIVRNGDNVSVFASHCDLFTLRPGLNRVQFHVPSLHLAPGLYSCAVGINEKTGEGRYKLHGTYSGIGRFIVESRDLHAVQANALTHIPGNWSFPVNA